MFEVDLDVFSNAVHDVKDASVRTSSAIEDLSRQNMSFVNLMSGGWADARSREFNLLEMTLRAMDKGLEGMANKFAEAEKSLEETVASARDALLAAASTEAANGRRLRFEDGHNVDGYCQYSIDSVRQVQNGISDVLTALDGLENADAISNAINSLSEVQPSRVQALRSLRTAYRVYRQDVESFEDTYAAALASKAFLTDQMVSEIESEMGAKREEILNSAPFKVSGAFDNVTTLLTGITETIANLHGQNIVFLQIAAQYLNGSVDKGMPLLERLNGAKRAFRMSNSINIIPSSWDDFWGMTKDAALAEATDWLKPSKWKEAGKSAKSLLDTVGEEAKGFFGPRKTGKGFGSSFDSMGSIADRAAGAVKGLGYIGNVIHVVDTVGQAGAAFNTTVGDASDKVGAAAVEVAEGAVEFGVGVGVGAAVGAIGGPLGIAAGVAIGWGAGKLLEAGEDFFEKSGAKKAFAKGISNGIDAIGNFFGL